MKNLALRKNANLKQHAKDAFNIDIKKELEKAPFYFINNLLLDFL